MLDLAFDEENAKLASEVRSFLSLRPINILTPLEGVERGQDRLSCVPRACVRESYFLSGVRAKSVPVNRALVKTVDANGKSIFAARKFTAFSNVEEKLFGTVKEVPFSVEDKAIEIWGLFEKETEPWAVSTPTYI